MKKQPLIKWQPNMKKVLYALVPVILASIYFFGWKSLVILVVVNIAGFLTEFIFNKILYKEPVSSAVFVTNCLFALTLPPTIPIWIAVVGIIFGVLFGKMVFGGFGRNIFNPALVGRAFIYISFGAEMTASWVEPVTGAVGGLGTWLSDSISQATPMKLFQGVVEKIPTFLNDGSIIFEETSYNFPSILRLLIGNISGCLGETSAILLIIGGVYLLITKTANYRIVLSGFFSFLLLQTIFWLAKVPGAFDPVISLLTGGFILGIFFMATDPISAASTNLGRWINGLLIGSLTVLIRVFANWKEGLMFAVLLANMFTPIIDYAIKEVKSKKKKKEIVE